MCNDQDEALQALQVRVRLSGRKRLGLEMLGSGLGLGLGLVLVVTQTQNVYLGYRTHSMSHTNRGHTIDGTPPIKN